jgi:pimeloyl-ACP methyl ester carboxylesterase
LTWAHSEGVEPQPSDLAAVRVGGHGSARPTVTFEAEQGRPAILYGVSYGAEGALLIASYEPHLFDAVVASSPSSEINGAYGGKPGPAWAFHRTALLTNPPPVGQIRVPLLRVQAHWCQPWVSDGGIRSSTSLTISSHSSRHSLHIRVVPADAMAATR